MTRHEAANEERLPPRFPARRPLEPSDQPLLRAASRRDPPEISDLTFACLWIWRRTNPVEISELHGGLVLTVRGDGSPPYALPPLGMPDPPAAAAEVLEALRRSDGPGAGLRLVPEDLARRLERLGLRVEEDRAAADYVYRTSDLIDLPGRRYDAKRNWIRRCLAAHRCEYVPLAGQVVAQCAAYMEEWCAARRCEEDAELCAEASAVREAFAAWEALGLRGGAIVVDGRVRAFAVSEELAPGTAVQHFEKADAAVPGLYQVVNQWHAREELSRYEWVNREEDLGNPGLRQAKMSYHPARLVRKYVVTRGDGG